MESEFFGDLFTDYHQESVVVMAEHSVLEGMSRDTIAELSGYFANSLTPPGHMPIDDARRYMSKIVTLFGEDEAKVSLALAGWAAVHDVGAPQDFGSKPPIVCGTKAVKAAEVFGGIIPVTKAGEPRQFCATMFEKYIDTVLDVFPQIHTLLAARAASAGLSASDPKAVISFLKGVTPTTMGDGTNRTMVKSALLVRNSQSQGSSSGAMGASNTVVTQAIERGSVAKPSSGHNLY